MGERSSAATVSGPLSLYAAGYQRWLAERGFARPSRRVCQLDHLSRWLECEGLRPDELTPERVERFLVARRAAGYASWVSPLSMRLPLDYLRAVGVVSRTAAPRHTGPRLTVNGVNAGVNTTAEPGRISLKLSERQGLCLRAFCPYL